jgi:hypothetical protein
MEFTLNSARGTLFGKRHAVSHAKKEVCLDRGEIFRLEGDRRGWVVQALEGRVWLTEAGAAEDVILEKQQTFRIDRKGVVLVQGLPSGQVRVVAG